MFNPTEIIFSATGACNLHCDHCFVNRNPQKLSIDDAKMLILSCKSSQSSQIQKIGFSGGEPFLYFEFLIEITKFTIEQDLLFDQIMTNGDWWKTEEDLNEKLQTLYNAGYDGKFGVSYDKFHGQTPERMTIFISTVQKIFGEDTVNIQTVGESLPLAPAAVISQSSIPAAYATPSAGSDAARNACFNESSIKKYFLPQTFPSKDERAWQAKRWFKDDYCEGPGNIFYVHSDGNIAPCCGFANENPQLFIGKITDSFETLIKNAASNKMIEICYTKGLGKARKQIEKKLKKQKNRLPGKTSDICTFCDYLCSHPDYLSFCK